LIFSNPAFGGAENMLNENRTEASAYDISSFSHVWERIAYLGIPGSLNLEEHSMLESNIDQPHFTEAGIKSV
jgi:hypothetical protein